MTIDMTVETGHKANSFYSLPKKA